MHAPNKLNALDFGMCTEMKKNCENLHHGDMIAIKIFTRTQMKRGCEGQIK